MKYLFLESDSLENYILLDNNLMQKIIMPLTQQTLINQIMVMIDFSSFPNKNPFKKFERIFS